MAAGWAHLVATGSTTDGTTVTSGSFTPTAGGVLAFYVMATGSVAAAPTLTASANGITFTRLSTSATKNGVVDTTYFFIANQVTPGSPASMTVTFTCTSDAATAFVVSGGEITGTFRVGTNAVLQIKNIDEVAGGTAPATVFAASAKTNNVTLFGQASTVGTARTQPSGWTKQGETFTATPTSGFYYGSRTSGFTGTTITSGATTNGAASALSVEFDSTADASGTIAAVSTLVGNAQGLFVASGTIAVVSALVGSPWKGGESAWDFENGIVGWGGNILSSDVTTLAEVASPVHGGTKALQVTFPTQTGLSAGAVAKALGMKAGHYYLLSVWARADTGDPDWRPDWLFGSGVSYTVVTTKNAYVLGEAVYLNVSGADTFVGINATSYSAGKHVWVDDVSIKEIYEASGTIAAVSALVGNAQLKAVASGTITATSTLVGNPQIILGAPNIIPVVSTLVGAVTAKDVASGTIPVVSTLVGDATVNTSIKVASGTIAIVSTLIGAVTAKDVGSGTIAVVSTLVGAVTAKDVASGTIPVVSALVGSVTAKDVAAGTTPVVSALSGNATIVTGVISAAGTVAVVCTVRAVGTSPFLVVLVRLRMDRGEDQAGLPGYLWDHLRYPFTQTALLLFKDGTVIPTLTLEGPLYYQADAVAAGGHDSQYMSNEWQAQVLAAAGYTLEPVT